MTPANMNTDKWEDPTVRQLTPQLLPVFQAVLSDDDQLEDDTTQHDVATALHTLVVVYSGDGDNATEELDDERNDILSR